jgi:hypothetical protein
MQLNPFTTDQNIKVAPAYPMDPAATLQNWDFYTDEQFNLNFSTALSGIIDVKTNNFTQLFLSKRKKLSDFFTIDRLQPIPESFSTFFGFRSTNSTNKDTLYWSADDSVGLESASANLTIEQVTGSLSNRHFFDIVFLDELTCKISHEHNSLVRYLTVDYSFNLILCVDLGLSSQGIDDPQTFYYFYDDANDLLILYKKLLDFPYFITYTTATYKCALRQPPLGPYFPFSGNGIMRMRPHTLPSSSYALQEHEAVYTKDTLNSDLNTSDESSRTDIQNNYLLHTEFYKITGSEMPVNILTLKNELTPQNNNVDKVDYFVTDQFDYRQYNKIFSGTNQTLGNDTISLGYDGYTHLLNLKPDKVTYFHVPYNLYPYVQLNINDTSLTQIGALGADHPVKADKIFKKRAIYGNYTPFGNATDEANGTFLCAWLSASLDPTTKPVWMDRYYNPSILSFSGALTATNNTSYISNFDNLELQAPLAAVFDKPSDLYLEPGVYYAYHHLGSTDIENYLKTLIPNTIQSGLTNYYINNTTTSEILTEINEFAFDGQQYSVCDNLNAVKNTNQFTISFDLNANSWSSHFANQIVGNYLTDGFGIFVDRYITPFIYYFAGYNLYIYNSTGRLLHTIAFQEEINAIWRLDNLNDYYVLFKNGDIIRNNIDNTTIDAATSGLSFDSIITSFYDLSGATFVGAKALQRQVIYYNFSDSSFTDVSNSTQLNTLNNIDVNSINSIVHVNNNFYGLSSFDAILSDNSIYYLSNSYEIRKWNLTDLVDYPFFTATIPIKSFNIDKNNNFWILQDTKVYVYTSDRQPINNFNIDNATKDSYYINFGNEFIPTGELYYAAITTHRYDPLSDKKITTLRYTTAGEFLNKFDTQAVFGDPLMNQNVTGDDFVRREALSTYYPNTINVKASLTNVINSTNTDFNLSYGLDLLGPGYHNITARIDGVKGSISLFIDGLKKDEVLMNPGEYILSNTFQRPLILGATSFFNSSTLPQYLKTPQFYTVGCKIKNFSIYQIALNDFDIRLFSTRNTTIPEINYNIPGGKRGYVEEIERVFKQDVPIKKSSAFNMKLINLGNISNDLKAALEATIKQQIQSKLPYNAELKDIKWIN